MRIVALLTLSLKNLPCSSSVLAAVALTVMLDKFRKSAATSIACGYLVVLLSSNALALREKFHLSARMVLRTHC